MIYDRPWTRSASPIDLVDQLYSRGQKRDSSTSAKVFGVRGRRPHPTARRQTRQPGHNRVFGRVVGDFRFISAYRSWFCIAAVPQVVGEPAQDSRQVVDGLRESHDAVSLAGVDDKLARHVEGAERAEEFLGL